MTVEKGHTNYLFVIVITLIYGFEKKFKLLHNSLYHSLLMIFLVKYKSLFHVWDATVEWKDVCDTKNVASIAGKCQQGKMT